MANEKELAPGIINFPSAKPDTSALAAAQRTASLQSNAPTPVAKPAIYYTPAFWNIEVDGEGIIATHNILGDVFKGTCKEFNELLRGV